MLKHVLPNSYLSSNHIIMSVTFPRTLPSSFLPFSIQTNPI
jgi:hypothetical protein